MPRLVFGFVDKREKALHTCTGEMRNSKKKQAGVDLENLSDDDIDACLQPIFKYTPKKHTQITPVSFQFRGQSTKRGTGRWQTSQGL